MKINKQELAEFYKEIEVKRLDDGIIVVNLWKDKKRERYNAISLMFAYGKIIYTGDMGYYIFGRDVNNIFNFYKGDEINPEYWSEKVHCADRPIIDDDCDIEKLEKSVREDICEFFEEDELSEEHQEAYDDCFDYGFDSNSIRAYDAIKALYEVLHINPFGRVEYLIRDSQSYNRRYLYACEVLQWVSNNLDKWLEERK